MVLESRIKLLRVLFSGFALNGLGAIIGLIKMGIVANSISNNLLSSYFVYLAIWGWFATNGESVRQFARQQNSDSNWKLGIGIYKSEWKFLIPFTFIVLFFSTFSSILASTLKFQDLMVTLICGWLFVYTSSNTGYLESSGKVELSNWITLLTSLFTLPIFIYLVGRLSFSYILFAYFTLNLLSGLAHGFVLTLFKNHELSSISKIHKVSENFEFKKIVLLESMPRVAVPLLISHFGYEEELTIYSVLIRVFIIYSIYNVSINPLISLKNKRFSGDSLEGILRIAGPVVFVTSSLLVIFFSGNLIKLIGGISVHPRFMDITLFILLGLVSIFTQSFIGSMSSGINLLIRRKSVVKANLLGILYLPFLVGYLGSIGGLGALILFQCTYFISLKRGSRFVI